MPTWIEFVGDDVADVGDRVLRGSACEVAVSAAAALSRGWTAEVECRNQEAPRISHRTTSLVVLAKYASWSPPTP